MRKNGLIIACLMAAKVLCAEGFRVVCTSSIPADWARNVAHPSAEVSRLMTPGTDPHAFQPTPGHVKRLLGADLIVGFDPLLEPWLQQIVLSNKLQSKVLWIGKPWISDRGDHLACCPEDTSGAKHALLRRREPVDPHVWTDPELVAAMARALHAGLLALPASRQAEGGEARLTAFLAEVAAVDAELGKLLRAIPEERRGVLTHHDNLGRIAGRYGLRVEGVILKASTSEAADPSAREMVRLVELARRRSVRAIVVDRGQRAPAAETIAREAGLPPPVALRLDTLAAAGEGATWAGMMRESARALAEALSR
jgi:zinc/manganese transport system substrate-binding protein